VQLLKRARDERPRDVKLLTCLADGLYMIGEWRQAESSYLRLIEEYPRNKNGYLGVARANEMQGRNDRAADFYRQVLAIDPKNRTALTFLDATGRAPSRDPAQTLPPR
jgi:tetratricopeptide (TPR) repeat protein